MGTQQIAVIGAGIAGLSSTWLLSQKYNVTLFERDDWYGGHAHTVDVATECGTFSIDTGFVVYNEKNYPNLIALFEHLNVATQETDMSFAVSLNRGELEYSGDGLNGIFAQRRNLFNPQQWRLLFGILKFNRAAKIFLQDDQDRDLSLGEFLRDGDHSEIMQQRYLLPMGAAIWSCPVETMLEFPAHSFIQFCENHGLLDLKGRPQWRTLLNGSQQYVRAILDDLPETVTFRGGADSVARNNQRIQISSSGQVDEFDHVVFACHADDALALLEQPSKDEQRIVGSFKYQKNHTWLHSDDALMPKTRTTWSSWNYLAQWRHAETPVMSATYWANNLHRFDCATDYFVSLNPPSKPAQSKVLREMWYTHPIFDQAALLAKQELQTVQGNSNTWYCGSYAGFGFHEDAISSAMQTCALLGVTAPWVNND